MVIIFLEINMTIGLILIHPQVGGCELQQETVSQQVVDDLAKIPMGLYLQYYKSL